MTAHLECSACRAWCDPVPVDPYAHRCAVCGAHRIVWVEESREEISVQKPAKVASMESIRERFAKTPKSKSKRRA